MRYLAIDLGQKRTGLATGDDQTRLAGPIGVLRTSSPEERWRQLAQVIAEHQPDGLVVGLPLNMDGTEGPAAKQVRQFAGQLQARFGLPVHLVDERLSSAAAEELLAGSGLSHRQKKARRDALAAATVLNDFLAGR